jgi:hypothetical protein
MSSRTEVTTPENGSFHQEESVHLVFRVRSDAGVGQVTIENQTTGERVVQRFGGQYNVSSDWQVRLAQGWNVVLITVNGNERRVIFSERDSSEE